MQLFGDCSADLCYFDAVRKACSVVVVQARSEDLRFAFEPTEGLAVNYTVAVTFKIRAIWVWLFGEISSLCIIVINRIIAQIA